ncbi:MAG: THUMP domain-containing protein [Bacteroidales bacterium]|jgi:putative N6-adenine-specific DNA methylase
MKQQDDKMEMVAKTFPGLEEVLAGELKLLGAKGIEILNRAVRFYGDRSLLYKANLYLRTALRILLPVLKGNIKTQIDLYALIKDYEWERHIKPGMTLAVDTFLNSSVFTHSQFVSLRAKDAITDRLRQVYNRRPSVNKNDPDVFINVHLASNALTVSLDSSGYSLHKRGYRKGNFDAPVSEVLAAGLIMLTGWRGEKDLYDPMCGSGTIGIEAALIAREIPPGIFRTHFGFERHLDFDEALWNDLYDDIREKEWNGTIYASDISKQAIKVASLNAKNASVLKNILYKGIDFRNYPPTKNEGLVIINPPYGERMGGNQMINFYKIIGDSLKKNFTGSEAWIISSNLDALKHVGLRPVKRYKLYNGALECRFNKYEIYPGSRKKKFSQ